jgi:hypothetical protein
VTHLSGAEILIVNQYTGNRGKLSFQSSRALAALRARLLAWRAFATRPAPERASAIAAATMAGLLAAPGGAPGAGIFGAAALAHTLAPKRAVDEIDRKLWDIAEDLNERRTLAAAPLVFSLIGTAVPLLLRHNNRLVPFFVAFALVGLTYFLPFFTARSLSDGYTVAPDIIFPPIIAITLACGAWLLWRVFRR